MSRLPQGLSWPLKPSDIGVLFPDAGYTRMISGVRMETGEQGPRVLLDATWTERSRITQPMLTIFAVPSNLRSELARIVESQAAPAVQSWMASIPSRGDGWRMLDHEIRIWWTLAGDQIKLSEDQK